MRSKLVLGGAVVLLAAAAAVFLIRSRPAAPAPAAAQPVASRPAQVNSGGETAQQQLSLDIIRNGLTLDKAKRMFSMVFGDLPGIVTPPGARDPDQFCGTLAANYIYRFWNELAPTEQAAAEKVLGRRTPPRPSPRSLSASIPHRRI